MKKLFLAIALMLPLMAAATDIETIKEEWSKKVITNVPTAGLGIMLERFDMTWPTASVGDVCQVMQTGVAKKVLDDDDGYTVEVDGKNGYVESYTAGSDRQTMSACVWRRTDGHRLFAVVISQPADPETEIACFYDYDPQKQILTPEPEILDNILPLFPTAYMSFVLPKTGKDLIVSEYSSGYTYKRIYKWDGMIPAYDRTEKIALDDEDTSVSTMTAQDKNAQLAQIRKQYAEAKQQVANAEKLQKEGQPGNILTVTNSYQMPGCGPTDETIHYYYNGKYDEEVSAVIYHPYLITRKFNVAARQCYQEFLFDKDGNAVFFFEKAGADELRYYWGENNFFHETLKGDRSMDDAFANRLATDLKDAFDKLMNRNY